MTTAASLAMLVSDYCGDQVSKDGPIVPHTMASFLMGGKLHRTLLPDSLYKYLKR